MLDFDFIDWDDEGDPAGNVAHIEAADLTPAEVEEVLCSATITTGTSKSSGRPCVCGHTVGGKFIIVVYEIDEDGGVRVLRPITAYEVPQR